MCRCLAIAVVLNVVFAVSSASAEDIAARSLNYFPGKWVMKTAEGTGTVQWKKVAGGTAIAGAGQDDNGIKSHSMAGWDSSKKAWLHSWFSSDGSSGCLEITKFEKDTYIGTGRSVDAEGKTVTGPWRNKIIDNDHFEITHETEQRPIVSKWERIKD